MRPSVLPGSAIWKAILCFAVAQNAFSISFDVVNPFPKLPYEATSAEQDKWVLTAKRLVGDSVEEAALSACENLINHPRTPPELKRWATLQQAEILVYCRQEWIALDILERWLAEHEDAEVPNPLHVRIMRAQIMYQRRHINFQATFDEIWAAFDDIFSHHDGNEWELIEAHAAFAEQCYLRYFWDPRQDVLEDRILHLMVVESKIRENLAVAEQAGDIRGMEVAEKRLRDHERITPSVADTMGLLEYHIELERTIPAEARAPGHDRPPITSPHRRP